MRYLLPLLLLAACDKGPRENRAIQAVQMLTQDAKCQSVSLGDKDTAYCKLNGTLSWCEASATTPITCTVIGRQQAEASPAPTPAPTEAPPAPAKESK